MSDATSTMGEVMAARKYDAWGNHRSGTAPSANHFKLGFTGHQLDVETGLTYARARYYDSNLGRFISRDSYEGELVNAPSLHRYTYASGNPLRYTDPTGFASVDELEPGPVDQLLIYLGWKTESIDPREMRPLSRSEVDGLRARREPPKLKEYVAVESRSRPESMTATERNLRKIPPQLATFRGEYEKAHQERIRLEQVQLQGTTLIAGAALTMAVPAAAPLLVETAGVTAVGAGGLTFIGGTASGVATEYGLTGEVTPEGVALSVATSGLGGFQSARHLSPLEEVAAARSAFMAEDAARLSTSQRSSILEELGPSPMRSPSELMGVEPASEELLDAVRRQGRTIEFAQPGSEEMRYLEYMQAEANVGGENMNHILLRSRPSKAAILEEFLHGTQHRLGTINRLGRQGAEVHVKEFMLRHRQMLGIGSEDAVILDKLLESERQLLLGPTGR